MKPTIIFTVRDLTTVEVKEWVYHPGLECISMYGPPTTLGYYFGISDLGEDYMMVIQDSSLECPRNWIVA